MSLRAEEAHLSRTCYTNFERIVNAVIPLKNGHQNMTLDDFFKVFRAQSAKGLSCELLVETSSTKVDF